MTHYEKYQAISVKEKGNHQFVEIHQIIPSGTKEYTAILNIYDKK